MIRFLNSNHRAQHRAKPKTSHSIDIDGKALPVIVRKHPTSKRMTIRYQPLKACISLTLPRYVSLRQGLRFIEEKRSWIELQLSRHGRKIPLVDGAVIPVLGKRFTLKHAPGRGVVRAEGEEILVPGDERFLGRRVRDWLIEEARAEISRLSHEKAAKIGEKVKRISLRDTGSHWGSCNQRGNISYSWRLVFAPVEVLDYIVSHEVAHLAELNHSKAFWSVVAQLCPHYKEAQAWLEAHGSSLYGYN